MIIFDEIEKLINEHGSATILHQRLEFAKEQFLSLESKVNDHQKQLGRLEAQLEREREDHKLAREELQRIREEHAEDIRIHKLVEFHRGKRTGNVWLPFCPKCHMPADGVYENGQHLACCTASCGWMAVLPISLESVGRSLQ